MLFIKITRTIIIIIVVSVALLSNGCEKQINNNQLETLEETSLNPNNEQFQQVGYTYFSNTSAMFMRWAKNSNNIVGQLQTTALDKDNNIQSSNHSFNGVKSDSKISIVFTNSVWIDSFSGITWTGTLENNALNLIYPSKNGTLETVSFKVGTVEDYNQAVQNLRRTKDIKDCQLVIEKHMTNIARNSEIIEKDSTDVKDIVESIPMALSKENESLSKTGELLKNVLSKKQQGLNEIDINNAAISVDYEKNNVDYKRIDALNLIDKANAKIKEMSDNMTDYKHNYDIILSLQNKLSVLDSSSIPQEQLEQLKQIEQQCLIKYTDMGNATINKYTPIIETYRNQANQMLKQAEEYSSEAYKRPFQILCK